MSRYILEAVIPNFVIHEYHKRHRMNYNRGLTKYNNQPQDGFISPPDLPGIGNEFTDAVFSNSDNRKVTV